MSNTTYNKYFIRTYASVEQIREIMAEHDSEIKAFAFIEHNRDNCEWHRHISLWLTRSKSKTTIENWFKPCIDSKGMRVQTFVECTKQCKKSDGTVETQTVDLRGATYYLVHEKADGTEIPNKYHYSWEDVESKNLSLLKEYEFGKTKDNKEDNSFEILERVIAGENLYTLAKEYGRDFIMNYTKYRELAYSIKCAEQQELDRQRECEENARNTYLAELLECAEPMQSAIVDAQSNEIERLRSILHANGIHNFD